MVPRQLSLPFTFRLSYKVYIIFFTISHFSELGLFSFQKKNHVYLILDIFSYLHIIRTPRLLETSEQQTISNKRTLNKRILHQTFSNQRVVKLTLIWNFSFCVSYLYFSTSKYFLSLIVCKSSKLFPFKILVLSSFFDRKRQLQSCIEKKVRKAILVIYKLPLKV